LSEKGAESKLTTISKQQPVSISESLGGWWGNWHKQIRGSLTLIFQWINKPWGKVGHHRIQEPEYGAGLASVAQENTHWK